MLTANNLNLVDMRDARYNQIIHMVSAANGAEEFYTIEVSRCVPCCEYVTQHSLSSVCWLIFIFLFIRLLNGCLCAQEHSCRSEGVEKAREIDNRNAGAWLGHPYFDVIDNSSDFETKIRRLIAVRMCHLWVNNFASYTGGHVEMVWWSYWIYPVLLPKLRSN